MKINKEKDENKPKEAYIYKKEIKNNKILYGNCFFSIKTIKSFHLIKRKIYTLKLISKVTPNTPGKIKL